MKIFTVIVFLVIAAAILVDRSRNQSREKALEKERTRLATLGYPAPVSEIKDDGVYWVNVSHTDAWQDTTNHYVLVREVKIRSATEYAHERTERLFELPFPLRRGYYRFHVGATNF